MASLSEVIHFSISTSQKHVFKLVFFPLKAWSVLFERSRRCFLGLHHNPGSFALSVLLPCVDLDYGQPSHMDFTEFNGRCGILRLFLAALHGKSLIIRDFCFTDFPFLSTSIRGPLTATRRTKSSRKIRIRTRKTSRRKQRTKYYRLPRELR